MTMAKILSGYDNDSTNKQVKSWSFSKRRRQQLQNINNSLCSNKTRLFILESFYKDGDTLHQCESNLNGLSSRMEGGLKIGVYSVTWWP